jgi:hypothetical protein
MRAVRMRPTAETAQVRRTVRTIARCTDNARHALAMHVARAKRVCRAHHLRASREHRQLKKVLVVGNGNAFCFDRVNNPLL